MAPGGAGPGMFAGEELEEVLEGGRVDVGGGGVGRGEGRGGGCGDGGQSYGG